MTRGPGGRDGGEGSPLTPGWPLTGRVPPPPVSDRTGRGAAASGGATPSLFDAAIPGASPASAVSISTVTHSARHVIEGAIQPLWVRGEVSDFKAHRSGHWYFNLRDQTAQLRCVVWASDQRRIPAAPDDGMAVVAFGQVTVYPMRGEVQLRVTALDAVGDGLKRKARDRTLDRLKRDGLLAPERKRALPRYPRCLALITSPDGAALHDIVAVARRRAPGLRIVVVSARVQGEGAAEELCAALDRVRRWGAADVVILGRGGGAKEDLGAFDDERVARAVAACHVPTVSAVGHEIDMTLCDLVADCRAPTPSAAAEAAVPLTADDELRVRTLGALLATAVRRRLQAADARMTRAADGVRTAVARTVERRRGRLEGAAGRLHALSPLATLARGFAVARDASGRALTSTADFAPGMPFDLVIRDGVVGAVTAEVHPATREGHP